jgi:hypothetical protein
MRTVFSCYVVFGERDKVNCNAIILTEEQELPERVEVYRRVLGILA